MNTSCLDQSALYIFQAICLHGHLNSEKNCLDGVFFN